jgi:hypothetical protein
MILEFYSHAIVEISVSSSIMVFPASQNFPKNNFDFSLSSIVHRQVFRWSMVDRRGHSHAHIPLAQFTAIVHRLSSMVCFPMVDRRWSLSRAHTPRTIYSHHPSSTVHGLIPDGRLSMVDCLFFDQ